LATLAVLACKKEPAEAPGQTTPSATATTDPDADRLSGVIQLDADGRLACALDDEGVIYCWGKFEFQSDAPIDLRTSTPIPLPGIDAARSLLLFPLFGVPGALGYAVERTGEVKAWGEAVGAVYAVTRMGDPEVRRVESKVPELAALALASAHPDEIAAFDENSASDRLQAANSRRALATRVSTKGGLREGPCVVGPPATDAAALGPYTCVFTDDEPLWGRIDAAEPDLGMSGCAVTSTGSVVCWRLRGDSWGDEGTPEFHTVPLPGPAAEVVWSSKPAGCWTARLQDGHVASWCQEGPERAGPASAWTEPTLEPEVTDVIALDEGHPGKEDPSALCALRRDGSVRCWVPKPALELSPSYAETAPTESTFQAFDSPVDVAAGASFVCVLTSKGQVQCAGTNREGECGTGGPFDHTRDRVPTPSYVVAPVTNGKVQP
jgi:hypothetical protein